jgi:hypothetical protein
MKVYGALESAQIEWFTNAGKPAASSYPYRVIYVTDLKQIQVSDGTNWNPSAVYSYTVATLPAAGASNNNQIAFITDTLQVKVSNGTEWKTIGARLDTFTSGTIPAAASNTNSLIWVSDLQQVQVSNGTSWVQVGSKAGTKNYFSQNNANPDFETNSVTPWSACTITFSSGVPSGAPTLTATQMAISTTSTTPLAGTYSMLLTKSAANAQYQGFISGALTIDREDTAKVLYGSFNYEVVSGTIDLSGSSTQSLEIWIYNTVSGAWTQPAGYRGMNQSSGVGKVVFSFQTDGTFANNIYKIAVFTQQTSTSAFVVEFDDFQVGPAAIVLGTPLTDWVDFTPTYAGGGSATYSTRYSSWRRNGDTMEIKFGVLITAAGSGASTWTIALPNGLSIDTSKLKSTTGYVDIGSGDRYAASTTSHYSTFVRMLYSSPTVMQIVQNHAGSDAPFTGAGLVLNDQHYFNVSLPIIGWGSTSQVSSDTDTRVVAMTATGAAPAVTSGNPIIFPTVTFDTHGGYNSTTGKYTIPVSGIYKITAQATPNWALYTNLTVYKNNASFGYPSGSADGNGYINSEFQYQFNAGDIIDVRPNNTSTVNTGSKSSFTIERLSGPSVITATETVACSYNITLGGQSVGTSATLIKFENKVYDSHNSYSPGTTGTGLFTAPISGKYLITSELLTNSVALTGSNSIGLFVYKNGANYARLGRHLAASVTASYTPYGSAVVELNAGETMAIYAFSSVATTLASGTGTDSYFQIVRIGN